MNNNNLNNNNVNTTNVNQNPNNNIPNNNLGVNNNQVINNSVNNNKVPVNPDINIPIVNRINNNQNANQVPPTPKVVPEPVNEAPVNITPVENSGGGKGKTFLLIVFFILLGAFIMFLPEISEFLQNGKINSNNNEVQNGNLICTMDKKDDATVIEYEYTYSFTKKELMSAVFDTTLSSEDNGIIAEDYNSCKEIETVAKDLKGVEMMCTTSDNISTRVQSNDYSILDNSLLTKFTEAGGIYPEFKYKDDIYNIKSKMIKSGYDCEIKAK